MNLDYYVDKTTYYTTRFNAPSLNEVVEVLNAEENVVVFHEDVLMEKHNQELTITAGGIKSLYSIRKPLNRIWLNDMIVVATTARKRY
jgi:hypothetical protein